MTFKISCLRKPAEFVETTASNCFVGLKKIGSLALEAIKNLGLSIFALAIFPFKILAGTVEAGFAIVLEQLKRFILSLRAPSQIALSHKYPKTRKNLLISKGSPPIRHCLAA